MKKKDNEWLICEDRATMLIKAFAEPEHERQSMSTGE